MTEDLLEQLLARRESACIVSDGYDGFRPSNHYELKDFVSSWYVTQEDHVLIVIDAVLGDSRSLVMLDWFANDTQVITFASKPPRFLPYYVPISSELNEIGPAPDPNLPAPGKLEWHRMEPQGCDEVLEEEIERKEESIARLRARKSTR